MGTLHLTRARNALCQNAPCPILAVILSERSESKDLRFVFCREGGKPQNPTAQDREES
jgi:hypothetical protein